MNIRIHNINKLFLISIIATVSLVMHFKHFSKDLVSIHVWRQTETQTTIVNFYEEDFNILNPRQNNRGDGDGIFRMEFPLMQWMVAGTYKIFGHHLLITRLFMFVMGLFTIAGIYEMVLHVLNKKIPAILAAWTFSFSPGFYYYTINPQPDLFALCFSVWGLAFFFHWARDRGNYRLLLGGLFLSIGVLSKLPFILMFAVPWTYLLLKKRTIIEALIVSSPVVMPAAWYAWVVPHWTGNPIVKGIFGSNTPFITTLDYLQFNLISTLPEVILGYGSLILFIAGLYFLFRDKLYKKGSFPVFIVWGIAILAYFLFEINSIAKIHDYYLFPFYPMLFILVGYGADRLIASGYPSLKYLSYLIILAAPLVCYARMHGRWNLDSPGFNRDLLIYKPELRNAVPKNALCVVGDDVSSRIFFYYIDKKGWCFTNGRLDPRELEDMIAMGAKFLYCDNRDIDENPGIIPYLNHLISEHGSIKVFSLRSK